MMPSDDYGLEPEESKSAPGAERPAPLHGAGSRPPPAPAPESRDVDKLDVESSSRAMSAPPAQAPKFEPLNVEPLDAPIRRGIPMERSASAIGPAIESERNASEKLVGGGVKALDICPSCGAPMRGSNVLVCMRCGFDLKTMRTIETRRETVELETPREIQALSRLDRGGGWLPIALAALSGVVLLVAYLAGVHGLFPGLQAAAIEQNIPLGSVPALERMLGILRLLVFVAMLTGCGLAALWFVSSLLGMKVGDLRLAALRILAIVAVMRLATLVDFTSQPAEWVVEAIIQAAVFIGLSPLLFHLKPRDALTLGGSAIAVFLLVWLGAFVITWAAGA